MLGQSFLCLGGVEISNGNRVLTYVRDIGIGIPGNVGRCECDALDEPYPFSDPATDNAPWFDENVIESEEFLGVFLTEVVPQPNLSRASASRAGGGVILGPPSVGRRIIACKGTMFATTPSGMAYGESWLRNVLFGECSSCDGNDALILRACPEFDEYGDYDRYFRTITGCGLIDGPNFTSITNMPDCSLQGVDFQLAGGSYFFGPKETLLESYPLPTDEIVAVMASTATWPGDGVLSITIENQDATTPTEDILVQGRVSFDGTCNNLEGMPCFDVTVSPLLPEEILFMDGMREYLGIYKPAAKTIFPALNKVTTSRNFPFFDFPSVAPCTDLCMTFLTQSTNAPLVTVDFYAREV